jgi:predicted DsbA family dithiol-disulfide isomerase
MARLAIRMAIESQKVTADVVEASEFPYLVQKYRVMGVPKTIVNESIEVDGAVPEPTLLQHIQRAAKFVNEESEERS